MAKNKKSFILYADQKGVFEQLPDEYAGKLIKHIFKYVNDENPISEDLIINIAFEPIKQCLKRDLQRWEEYIDKQKLNGSKGGRPPKPKETQETQAFLSEPKKPDSVSVSDSVTDSETDKDSDSSKKQTKRFIKPTIEEIRTEMLKKQMNDESERFYHYYESKGWMVGKNKMKCWKSAIVNWKSNQKSNTTIQTQVQPKYKVF